MQEEQEDYQNEFGDFDFPSQINQDNFNDGNSYAPNVENPFDQFIPSNQQEFSSSENPFDQFIPKEQPNQIVEPIPDKSTFDKIVDPIIAAGDAAGKGIRHAASAPVQFTNPFVDAALGTNFTGDLNTANQRMDEEYRLKHPNVGITEQTLSNVTEGLPAILFGGASVPGLASKGISGLANLALSGAASAPLIYDESGKLNPLEKTGIGAAVGGGVYGLGRLGGLAAKGLKKIAGEISEKELKEVIEANKGLKTGIGGIINSPAIDKLQKNFLSHVPFSGVENTQIKTANKLTEEGHNILNNLLGEEDKKIVSEGGFINAGETLQKSLNALEESLNKEKRILYKDVDKIAKDSGVKVNATNYQIVANNILKDMKSSREFGKLANTDKDAFEKLLTDISTGNVGLKSSKINKGSTSVILKNEKFPTFSEPVVKYKNETYPVNAVDSISGIYPSSSKMISSSSRKYGEEGSPRMISSSSRKYPRQTRNIEEMLGGVYPKKTPISGSVKSANLKISDLNESATQEFIASNKFLGGAFNRLKKALQKDLRMSIKKSGNKQLGDAFSKAQKHYAENIGPFEDKDILKFTRKRADSDTLVSHFLKTGKNDRGNLLGKLVDKVGPEGKNSIAYEYFSPAFKDGLNGKEIMPRKMVNLYNKLGDRTKEKLFTPQFRKEMRRYGIRVNSNNSAFDAMANPNNGSKLSSIIPAAEIIAALTVTGAAAPLIKTSIGANLLNKGLNSEWLRNLYLKGYSPLRKANPIEGGLSALATEGIGKLHSKSKNKK